ERHAAQRHRPVRRAAAEPARDGDTGLRRGGAGMGPGDVHAAGGSRLPGRADGGALRHRPRAPHRAARGRADRGVRSGRVAGRRGRRQPARPAPRLRPRHPPAHLAGAGLRADDVAGHARLARGARAQRLRGVRALAAGGGGPEPRAGAGVRHPRRRRGVRRATGRLRAGDDRRGDPPHLRRPARRAGAAHPRDRVERAQAGRRVAAHPRPRGPTGGVQPLGGGADGLRLPGGAHGRLGASLLRGDRAGRRAHHHALPRRRLGGRAQLHHARGGARAVRAEPSQGGALRPAAGRGGQHGDPREPVAHLGEPGGPLAPLLGVGPPGDAEGARRARPPGAGRGDGVPRDERGAAGPDPGGKRRGDVQPAHHAALRPGARAAGGRPGRGRPPRRVERPGARRPGPGGAGRRAGRAAGHPLVDGRDRLLPHLHAGEPVRRPVLDRHPRRASRPGRPASPRRVRAAHRLAAREHPRARPALHRPRALPAHHRSPAGPRAAAGVPGREAPAGVRDL
ncbi:MAG: Thermostable carboxypeptidase 1, partial [uncultured Gemmatimonadetes bacterium]